jgi:hypothetical protein
MSFSHSIMNYLSTHCPDLKVLILYDCQQQKYQKPTIRVDIQLSNLSLDVLVLYRVRHPYQIVQSRSAGSRFLLFRQWYHLVAVEEGEVNVIAKH